LTRSYKNGIKIPIYKQKGSGVPLEGTTELVEGTPDNGRFALESSGVSLTTHTSGLEAAAFN
jgi:hypothetical protein